MNTCPLSNLICVFYVQIAIVVIAVAFGALLMWRPRKVIEIQTTFYRAFNWKIEPISMEKEIKNTRIMGMATSTAGIILLLYIIIYY